MSKQSEEKSITSDDVVKAQILFTTNENRYLVAVSRDPKVIRTLVQMLSIYNVGSMILPKDVQMVELDYKDL